MLSTLTAYYPESNEIALERLEPLAAVLLGYLNAVPNQFFYTLWSVFIFFAGCLCFFLSQKVRFNISALAAFAACMSVSLVVEFDPFRWRFAYFPFLLFAFCLFNRRPNFKTLLLALLVSALWIVHSTSLSFIGTLTALVVSLVLQEEKDYASFRSTCLLALFACLASIALLPVYSMDDYPGYARFAFDSSRVLLPASSVGPSLIPDPVIQDAIAKLCSAQMQRVALVIVTFWFACFFLKKQSSTNSGVCLAALSIYFLVLFVECSAQIPWAHLTPFQSLRRLIPGMGLVYSIGLLWPFVLVPCISWFAKSSSESEQRIPKGLSIYLTLLAVFFVLSTVFVRKVPLLAKLPNPVFHQGFGDSILASKYPRTPSWPIIESFGSWVSKRGVSSQRAFKNLERIKRSDVGMSFLSNLEESRLIYAGDLKEHTRWTTIREQKAGDFFEIVFEKPTKVVRMILSVRRRPSEFPRSFTVTASNQGGEYRLIRTFPNWVGSLQWTKEDLPYFADQSKVIIDFPSEQSVKTIRTTILEDSPAPWSVVEVKLYRTKP